MASLSLPPKCSNLGWKGERTKRLCETLNKRLRSQKSIFSCSQTTWGSRNSFLTFLSALFPRFMTHFCLFSCRFNSIWPRHGSCNGPECDSSGPECHNDLRVRSGGGRPVPGQMVQGKARVLPIHTEGDSVNKNLHATWRASGRKSISLFILLTLFKVRVRGRKPN